MKERLLFSLTAVLLLCYACNEEEGSGLSVTEAAAGNAVVSTARIRFLLDDPANEEALISLTRIYTDLTTLATNGGEVGVIGSLVPKGTLEDCVVVSDTVIRYDGCDVSNGTFDGTIEVMGDEITFDLVISVVATGAEGSLIVAMQGSILLTATTLSGELRYTTTIGGLPDFPGGLDLTLDANYVGVTLDDVQCPLSGSLEAEQRGPDADTGVREAVFGPSCEDVRIVE